jgi:leucyl/phenylalanyl-tRNA---protein transferase
MTYIIKPSEYFPPVHLADEDGLLCYGGDLSPEFVIDAYRHGIFPWPVAGDDMPMLWWSPDPRGIIPLDGFHISRRLARTLRSGRFEISFDQAFEQVVSGCADGPGRIGVPWINHQMQEGYLELHRMGLAHSVEVWLDRTLVGGIYGIAIGGLFAAESMYSAERDASKVALATLVEHIREKGFQLLDIQEVNDHTRQFGAIEIRRDQYISRLAKALSIEPIF